MIYIYIYVLKQKFFLIELAQKFILVSMEIWINCSNIWIVHIFVQVEFKENICSALVIKTWFKICVLLGVSICSGNNFKSILFELFSLLFLGISRIVDICILKNVWCFFDSVEFQKSKLFENLYKISFLTFLNFEEARSEKEQINLNVFLTQISTLDKFHNYESRFGIGIKFWLISLLFLKTIFFGSVKFNFNSFISTC